MKNAKHFNSLIDNPEPFSRKEQPRDISNFIIGFAMGMTIMFCASVFYVVSILDKVMQ